MEEALKRVDSKTCLDFVYFRQLLLRSRRLLDDSIPQRLNEARTIEQVEELKLRVLEAHRLRLEKLQFCATVIKEEAASASESIYQREVRITSQMVNLIGEIVEHRNSSRRRYLITRNRINRKETSTTSKQPITFRDVRASNAVGIKRNLFFVSLMTSDSEVESFKGELFPSSFTILYCPWDKCECEEPFVHGMRLIEHVKTAHDLEIQRPAAVLPFLDRYLEERISSREINADEDASLRQRLQQKRLEEILAIQEQERASSYRRGQQCLFCLDHLSNRYLLFEHMFRQHAFNIGQLDNLVMVEDFLTTLSTKIRKNECIYCEKSFPSGAILRKHMKNKGHCKIHPRNHLYDRHYIVNYLQPGVLYEDLPGDRDEKQEGKSASEEEWATLDDLITENHLCLFCPLGQPSALLLFEHMAQAHEFSWRESVADLDFYDCIRLINYIRWRTINVQCFYCDRQCADSRDLQDHLTFHEPFVLPDETNWKNKPQFLFPSMEDDSFLCSLEIEQ